MLQHNGKNLYTLYEHPDYCPDCHAIGGFCGHGCGGSYFRIKPAEFVLVTVEQCSHCNKQGENRNHVITWGEYNADRQAYDSGTHECTSSSTIFGGGACGNIIGHSVEALYT